MKTAISIPDSLFKNADRVARRLGISRSELYAKALAAFLEAHAERDVTGSLNRIYGDRPSSLDLFLEELQHASLSRKDW